MKPIALAIVKSIHEATAVALEGGSHMRKSLLVALLSAAVGVIGLGQAFANGGGMGDPSMHMKEMNAECDAQRRGEAPPYPNLCLPEYPLGPVTRDRRDHK
jgi:hypothetical protein